MMPKMRSEANKIGGRQGHAHLPSPRIQSARFMVTAKCSWSKKRNNVRHLGVADSQHCPSAWNQWFHKTFASFLGAHATGCPQRQLPLLTTDDNVLGLTWPWSLQLLAELPHDCGGRQAVALDWLQCSCCSQPSLFVVCTCHRSSVGPTGIALGSLPDHWRQGSDVQQPWAAWIQHGGVQLAGIPCLLLGEDPLGQCPLLGLPRQKMMAPRSTHLNPIQLAPE